MSHLVRPKVISPRGIIEGTHYVPCGGFALKAVDSLGLCHEFRIVRTYSEYVEAIRTLGKNLDLRDPTETPFDFDRAIAQAFRTTVCDAPVAPSAVRLLR